MRISFLLNFKPVSSFILFLLVAISNVQTQSFKSYVKFSAHKTPTLLTANDIVQVPGEDAFAITGEIKEGVPSYSASAYVLKLSKLGQVQFNSTISTQLFNSTNGVASRGLSMDKYGNYYLAGGSVQNIFGLGAGSEKTITALDSSGRFLWSDMQPNFSFDGILTDERDQSLITVSGPNGNTNPLSNIAVHRFNTSGQLLGDLHIQTPTVDAAVGIARDSSGGFLVSGVSDISNPNILLTRLDSQLNISWSNYYTHQDFQLEVKDISVHASGKIGLCGTATHKSSGKKHAFLYLLDELGAELSFSYFDIAQQTSSEAFGLTAFSARTFEGFLLAGAFQATGSNFSQSFVLSADLSGNLNWIRTYSNYLPSDNEYEEKLKAILFLPDYNQFAAVGEVAEYRYGSQLHERRIFLVRAGIFEGRVERSLQCSDSLQAQVLSDPLDAFPIGTAMKGSSVLGFSYQTDSLQADNQYCAFEIFNLKPKLPQKASMGDHRWAIQSLPSDAVKSIRVQSESTSQPILLSLYSIEGKILYKKEWKWIPGSLDLRFPGLSSGIYVVRIQQQDGKGTSQKVLIK